MEEKLRFTINGKVYYGILPNTHIVEQIIQMCPFETEFIRSGQHEYYSKLPVKINIGEKVGTTRALRNKLYFFDEWNALSFVIEDTKTDPWEIVYLGEFKDDVAKYLKNEKNKVHVKIEVV